MWGLGRGEGAKRSMDTAEHKQQEHSTAQHNTTQTVRVADTAASSASMKGHDCWLAGHARGGRGGGAMTSINTAQHHRQPLDELSVQLKCIHRPLLLVCMR
jgi:hypothetical protein